MGMRLSVIKRTTLSPYFFRVSFHRGLNAVALDEEYVSTYFFPPPKVVVFQWFFVSGTLLLHGLLATVLQCIVFLHDPMSNL